jgi:Calcineurin-like phosphoesterase
MSYDIIGDIHGHALTLEAMLRELGYSLRNGAYRHSDRQVIFLGDLIDRGEHQAQTLHVVRKMVDAGQAIVVMGNHEFNALAYATKGEGGEYLRPHSDKNYNQHKAFLKEYQFESQEHRDAIDWFGNLPLWLDFGVFRVIHACWDKHLVARITQKYGGAKLTKALLLAASNKNAWEYMAIETLLKGSEIPLPEGQGFEDSYGTRRLQIRTRWWDQSVRTYREAFLGAPDWKTHIPDDPIQGDHMVDYGLEQPPVFLGHYWLTGEPLPLAENVACLDYSVARPGGKLVVYRWDGSPTLSNDAFVIVERQEAD